LNKGQLMKHPSALVQWQASVLAAKESPELSHHIELPYITFSNATYLALGSIKMDKLRHRTGFNVASTIAMA